MSSQQKLPRSHRRIRKCVVGILAVQEVNAAVHLTLQQLKRAWVALLVLPTSIILDRKCLTSRLVIYPRPKSECV